MKEKLFQETYEMLLNIKIFVHQIQIAQIQVKLWLDSVTFWRHEILELQAPTFRAPLVQVPVWS